MPTKRIGDTPNKFVTCTSPDHLPTAIRRDPGTYKHTCSNCGYETIFVIGKSEDGYTWTLDQSNEWIQVRYGDL